MKAAGSDPGRFFDDMQARRVGLFLIVSSAADLESTDSISHRTAMDIRLAYAGL